MPVLYSHKCDRLPLSSQGKTLNLLLGIGDGISDGHALSSSQGKMVNLLLGISDEIGRRSRGIPYGSSHLSIFAREIFEPVIGKR